MKYKIIALDMDDTLLNDNLEIGIKTKEALLKAKEKGLKIVLASGRPIEAIKKYANELKLHESNGFIISYNGASLEDCVTDEVLFKQTLSNDYLYKIIDLTKKYNVYLHTYFNNYIVTDKNNKYTDIESKLTGIPIKLVENLKDYVNTDVIKAIALEEPTYLNEVKAKIIDEIGDLMSITISKPYFLEFMDKGVDKGKTLQLLAEKIGVDMSDVIAIGDSYNDITMIKAAGLGVAMGNANEDVKKIADVVIGDNENDGIADFIKEYLS